MNKKTAQLGFYPTIARNYNRYHFLKKVDGVLKPVCGAKGDRLIIDGSYPINKPLRGIKCERCMRLVGLSYLDERGRLHFREEDEVVAIMEYKGYI